MRIKLGKIIFHYVYLIKSINNSNQTYVGHTKNLKIRLAKHNEGGCPHTSKYKPWKLVTYLAFDDEQKSLRFEKYLKSGSGRSFASNRFW